MPKPKLEIDLLEVERLAGLGLSKHDIAAYLGISQRTLYNRQTESALFADAIKKGKAAAVSKAASALQTAIENGNLTAIIFYLKTQAGWTETQRQVIEDDTPKHAKGLQAIYDTMRKAALMNAEGTPRNGVSV